LRRIEGRKRDCIVDVGREEGEKIIWK